MTPDQFIYWLKGYLIGKSESPMKSELLAAIKDVEEKDPTNQLPEILAKSPTWDRNHTGGQIDLIYKESIEPNKVF